MTEIYSNHNFKLIKNDKNPHMYCIEFTYPNPILCNSLVKTKILRGATIIDDYKQVIFKAYSVQICSEFITKSDVKLAANMAATLGAQLKYIICENSHTFLGYNTDNMIVVDETKTAFLDCNLVTKITDKNGTIMVCTPFESSDFFLSPELKRVNVLPVRIHYKTAYFSLGCLLLRALLGAEIFTAFYREYLIGVNEDVINKYLQMYALKETKLYWLICRCLVEEPENRSILFI